MKMIEQDKLKRTTNSWQLQIKNPYDLTKLSNFWFSIAPLCLEDHTRASTLNNEYLATGQMCVSYQMMNEKIFIWITYHTKPCWWYTVFGKIRTRNFPPRSPPSISSFSLISLSSFLFHVFSAENGEDHVTVFILLHCLPLTPETYFLDRKRI